LGKPELAYGRHVRQGDGFGRYRERLHLPRAHALQRARELIAAELHAAGDQVGDQRSCAAVRHVIHLDAGVAFQHLAHQMQDAAGSGRAVEQRRGRRLGVGDEFLEVVRRHGVVGEQQERHIGADRDRTKSSKSCRARLANSSDDVVVEKVML
jgi:hypothetical protein